MIFSAFSLWLVADSAVALYRASQADSWPTVPGQITSSGIAKGCGRGSSYYPVIRYSYIYDGKVQEGARVTFGNVGCGSAEGIAREFHVNKNVRVHINPMDPSDTVITTHVHEETKLGLLLMGTIFLVTTAWAIITLAQMRSNSTIERDARKSSVRPSL
jgi:hypothetical protein